MAPGDLTKMLHTTYGKQLRVRVCGLCRQEDRLLLADHRGLGAAEHFWIPPGGGVAFGSGILANLQREFEEETGLLIEVEKLIWIHEHLQDPLHALELFFSVRIKGGKLQLGHDPELPERRQQLRALQFFSYAEIEQLPKEERHPILHDIAALHHSLAHGPRFFFAK